MLKADSVTLCYETSRREPKKPVIQNLSFQLEEGKILSVAGPSGCGKTTLIRALAGLLPPKKGQLTFHGLPLDPDTCSIGLIPQNYGLLPWKTVRSNCLFCARAHNKKERFSLNANPALTNRLDALCAELGISSLLDRYPSTLSGGQAQRAALARAFLMDPQLLLMDEPFAALDIAAAAAARSLCLKLCGEYHSTAVIVTHRLEDAFYLADKIAVMGEGGLFSYTCENPWQGVESPDSPEYLRTAARFRREILKSAQKEALS